MKIEVLVSKSASITKSLRGTIAMVAKSKIKVEDDDHESNIKRGEKFYLKKLGQRHYLLDVEGKDLYQFAIDKKVYDQLLKKHTQEGESTKQKTTRKKKGSSITDIGSLKGTKARKPKQGGSKLEAGSERDVKSAASVLKERANLEKDKDVKAYLKAQRTIENSKASMTLDDPDKAQVSGELKKAKQEAADLMQKPKVSKYVENKRQGTPNDIMGRALEGKDAEYTKQKALFDKGFAKSNRRSMSMALKKMQGIIAKYIKALV